jgi:tRNA nucleotidyltransferase (CCA-adding enzyme)
VNEVLPPILARIFRETPELRQAYLVGGCVRDWLRGRPVKDFDIEVHGLDYDQLVAALARWGRADLVGRSFGVLKLTVAERMTFDFVLPRRDSKVSPGHKGFAVAVDPTLSLRDAAARRDFTVNALMFDPHTGQLLDFFGGERDLRSRVLRHVSEAFVDDPLRVLRGMQFAARFDLRPAPETLALCRQIAGTFGELAVERVRDEWFKWASQSVVPSRGLELLRDSGWLEHFPEVRALIGTPQDPEWHPEGDVFVHTGHCLDELVQLPAWREAESGTRSVLTLAVLAHDFAKPQCTHVADRDGRLRIVSPGHESAGGPLTEAFLLRIGAPHSVIDRVVPLVTNHLAHMQETTPRAIRRLARRLAPATIGELAVVITADSYGRPPRGREEPPGLKPLLAQAAALDLEAQAPKPILLGRHLIEAGLEPGPRFGELLEAGFEAQLEGAFGDLEGARLWLDRRLRNDA